MAVSSARALRWLQKLGIAPTDQDVAIAALAVSIEDWKRELKRSERRQRRDEPEDEDD